MRHRTSLYPLVIAGLTVGLVVLMAATLPRNTPLQPSRAEVSTVYTGPTDAQYEAQVTAVIGVFHRAYATATTSEAKLTTVETALHSVLGLTVPVRYKDLHYGLAVSLTLMRDGLTQGNVVEQDSGWEKYQTFTAAYPWLLK
jgi:predicted metal-binding membrane protein